MKTTVKVLCILIISISGILPACTKSDNPIPDTNGEYSVFAWNDLGMHCLNPGYDKLVILPPYNNLMVQVVKRGNNPEIVTSGITVSYNLIGNTKSYDKQTFAGFWDNSNKLFGVSLVRDRGLTGNGLSGNMKAAGNHFIADGIPVVPYLDNGTWDPYQVAEITVKGSGGNVLAKTQAMVPTSDEMNCAKCHGPNTFDNILLAHDVKHGTNFSSVANQPVLCAKCHPDPALGITTGPTNYLSEAMHGSHASKPGITCYDCHPGALTKCSRSLAHSTPDGNCTTCHGDMAHVASTIKTGRIPWAGEPKCSDCHSGVTGVNTGNELYRNSLGHGNMYCPSCHGSPHAMMPTGKTADNYMSKQYQGFTSKIKTIGSCGVCHSSSRGESNINEFAEEHGGSNPEKVIGCMACHTSIPTNTANWPHAYTWTNTN